MTKRNQLFEAIGNINDDIAANAIKAAEKSKRKRPLRITAVAAASLAAALALAVGIRYWGGIIGNHISPADSSVKQGGASYVASGFGESEVSSPNDSADDQNNKYVPGVKSEEYHFNVYPQNIIIPESFMPDNIEKGQFFFDVDMNPTEIFAEFGIRPPMNDNFTDIIEFEPVWIRNDITGEEFYYNGGPQVFVSDGYISFRYYLYDKIINKNIYFRIDYFTNFVDACGNYGGEVIYMKDGSFGIIGQNGASFAYDGAMYYVSVPGESDDGKDHIMDVLADLGVL